MNHITRLFLAALLSSALLACGPGGDDAKNNDANNSIREAERHACDHILNGPDAGAEAGAEAPSAPESWQPHTRVDVTLPTDGEIGYLRFTPAEAGTVEFFFDEDVTFAMLDGDVEVDATSTAAEAPGCPEEVLKSVTYTLEPKSYTLALGPSTSTIVSFFAYFTARDAGE